MKRGQDSLTAQKRRPCEPKAKQSIQWRVRLWIASLLMLFAMTAGPVNAQELKQWYEKDLPDIEFMPQAEFEAKTTVYEEIPYGDPSLAFQIRLPKDWIEREVRNDKNAVLTGLAPQEIALYTSPARADAQSSFRIKAIDLPVPISAEDWFLQYVITNGLTLEGISVRSRHEVEALIVQVEGDITYVIRTIARVLGDRIILTQFFVPTIYWKQERVIQAQSIASFDLTNKDAIGFDDVQRFIFPNAASLAYPDNWRIAKSRLYSGERLFLQIMKDSGRQFLDGLINVDVIPREQVTNMAQEVANLHLRAGEMRFKVDDLLRREEDYDFQDWIKYGVVEVYGAEHREQKHLIGHEFWLAALVTDKYYIFIMMLTPGKEDELTVWSENASTFQSVVESVAYVEPDLKEVEERMRMLQEFREMGLEPGND